MTTEETKMMADRSGAWGAILIAVLVGLFLAGLLFVGVARSKAVQSVEAGHRAAVIAVEAEPICPQCPHCHD